MNVYKQLKWRAAHDPCRAGDRSPVGAIRAGQGLRVVLRLHEEARTLVESATLLVVGERETHVEVPLDVCPQGFAATFDPQGEPHVAFYAFRLSLPDGALLYYVPCADGRSTAGELVCPGVDGEWGEGGWTYFEHRLAARPTGAFGLAGPLPGFQITVYEPWFVTPAWMRGAIMYQIFPDRFARGSGGVRAEGLAYHERMGRPVRLHESWDEPVEWKAEGPLSSLCRSGQGEKPPAPRQSGADGEAMPASDVVQAPAPAPAQPEAEPGAAPAGESAPEPTPPAHDLVAAQMKAYDPVDFYGGTLAGIREKLPYLASLGVEVLYLNPVFEARSNHRYDTADYERIDPLLGDRRDFEELVEEARRQGISVVLDAVLSHTGDDSRYFNAKGAYELPGAMQGAESPYRSWYDFSEQPDGSPYRSWWGHLSLPEVDERDPSWQRYMLGAAADGAVAGDGSNGEGDAAPWGVLGSWLSAGARGYRLDVADEIPDDVLERIRTCVKSTKPDAAIIGEVWEDATTKASYGVARTYALGRSLDSVMNYPLRDALVGFALGWLDARQLAAFLKLQAANYPQPMHACLMNLLSTHDVERVRSVLAAGGPLKHLTRDEQLERTRELQAPADARAARLQRLIACLMYALPGMPCIYYGDERGLRGGGDPFCRATFPWDERAAREAAGRRDDCGEDLTAFYQMLGQHRKASTALRTGAMACAAFGADTLCVVRFAEGEPGEVLVANRADAPKRVVVDLADLGGEALAAAFPSGDYAPALFTETLAAAAFPASARCQSGLFVADVPALAAVFYRR